MKRQTSHRYQSRSPWRWGPAALAVGISLAASGDVQADALQTPADRLPPLALFNRCYATIVRELLPPTQRYYTAVASGSMTATAACAQIIADASSGGSAADPGEKLKVIQTFSDFHRSWFSSDNYATALPGQIYADVAPLLHDPGEPAHYVTRSLFDKVPYSSVVVETSGMLAVRVPGAMPPAYPGVGMGPLLTNATTPPSPWNAPIQKTGDIADVERMADHPEYTGVVLAPIVGWGKPIPVFQHFGGGIIGSQSFLQLNYGRVLEDNDGGLKVPRRWAKAILSDLLCRDVPAIRLEDATPLVDKSSPLPFRGQASCMQCHGAMDPIAGTARNIRFVAINVLPQGTSTLHVVAYDPTGTTFATSVPTGKLMFRSFSGDLINHPVTGLGELGAALAETDDLYVCAAARYFEMFTGIRVSLQDLGDKSVNPLAPGDLDYRNQVIDMGKRFRSSNDVQALIKDIMATDFYQTVSMRKAVKVE